MINSTAMHTAGAAAGTEGLDDSGGAEVIRHDVN